MVRKGIVISFILLLCFLYKKVSTKLGQNTQYIWEGGLDSSDAQFELDMTLFYPTEQILYRPGFWYVVKWASIQYICVFVVFYFVFDCIKRTVFGNQIISTIVYYREKLPTFSSDVKIK